MKHENKEEARPDFNIDLPLTRSNTTTTQAGQQNKLIYHIHFKDLHMQNQQSKRKKEWKIAIKL